MPVWFYIALSAPALWGASNLIDKHLLEGHFKERTSGSFYLFGGIFSLLLILLIIIFYPAALHIPLMQILLLLGASITGSAMLFCYLQAMRLADPSVVISLFQVIPVFYALLAYVVFKEVLTGTQVAGSILIITAALALSLDLAEGKVQFRGKMLAWMLLACLLGTMNGVAFKYVGLKSGYFAALFWDDMGILIVCLAIFLCASRSRREFIDTFFHYKASLVALLFLNEVITTVGNFLFAFAGLLAPLALVQTVNGFQPVFVLLYSVGLALAFPRLNQENLAKRHLVQKVGAISIILIGTFLINH